MSREEEINNASYAYWVNNYANIEFIDEEEKELHTQDIQESFINGAEWADEHPKPVRVTFKEFEDAAKEVIDKDWQARQDRLWDMIERNFRAQFIRKACEWFKEKACCGWIEDVEVKYFIEDFRKAMKGD